MTVTDLPRPPRLVPCKGCGEMIFFAETRNGRRVPLDPDERRDGNIILEGDAPTAVYLHEGTAYIGPRYVSHYATCPDGARFRRDVRVKE